jgi:hypothetical protein
MFVYVEVVKKGIFPEDLEYTSILDIFSDTSRLSWFALSTPNSFTMAACQKESWSHHSFLRVSFEFSSGSTMGCAWMRKGGSFCLNEQDLTGINSASRCQVIEPKKFREIHLVFLGNQE